MAVPESPPLFPLTAREREVLPLVADGKRNSEIGCILQISGRTAEAHVGRILFKLGVETRGAAGAWWHRQHGSQAPPP